MKCYQRSLLQLLLAICIINSCSSELKLKKHEDNFLIVDHLSDNEKETRLKWKDLMGKETTLDLNDDERYDNSSLKMTSLWQITDGKRFAQLIFSGKNLIDCEYLEESEEIVDNFADKFIEEYNSIRHELSGDFGSDKHHKYLATSNGNALSIKSNATYITIKRLQQIPEYILELMNLKQLKKKCNQLHRQIRRKLQDEKSDTESEDEIELEEQSTKGRTKRQTNSWFIAPNTKWCGKGNNAGQYRELGASRGDVCCRKHDHCHYNIPGLRTKFGLFNVRPFTISHCRCDRRSRRRKRALNFLNELKVPYTKWCGKGWSAKKYSDIGGFSKTDKCCRSHDYCPNWIGSFERKWSLFNWSINVIMHCKCDERFRTCLKMADSSDANMVGKLFFNIVQIKCFVIKPEKACILYSWWGKCLKYRIKKKAYLRENQKY